MKIRLVGKTENGKMDLTRLLYTLDVKAYSIIGEEKRTIRYVPSSAPDVRFGEAPASEELVVEGPFFVLNPAGFVIGESDK